MTRAEAMRAKCKECRCGYADGRVDCEISHCALYPWMPYRAGRKDEPKPARSPAQQAADAKLAAMGRSKAAGYVSHVENGPATPGEGSE